MKLKHILILQNKIDLVKESQAKEQYEQILAFVQGELVGNINNAIPNLMLILLLVLYTEGLRKMEHLINVHYALMLSVLERHFFSNHVISSLVM